MLTTWSNPTKKRVQSYNIIKNAQFKRSTSTPSRRCTMLALLSGRLVCTHARRVVEAGCAVLGPRRSARNTRTDAYAARGKHTSSLYRKSRRCTQVDAHAAARRFSLAANGSPTKPRTTRCRPHSRICEKIKPADKHAATFKVTKSIARATDCWVAGAYTSPSVSIRHRCRSATTARYFHATVLPSAGGLAVVRN